MGYALTPRVVLLSLPDAQERVLLRLALHADNTTLEAWPKLETLAAECGKSVRAVRATLRKLEEAGAVEVVNHRAGGRGLAVRYRLHLPNAADDFRLKGKAEAENTEAENTEAERTEAERTEAEKAEAERTERRKVSVPPPDGPPPQTPPPLKPPAEGRTGQEPVKPAPIAARTETPRGRVIEAIRARGVAVPSFTGRDGKAVKEAGADPDLVAEAYVAAYRGEWGDDWLRRNLSIRVVIERLAGYLASKHTTNGRAAPTPDATGGLVIGEDGTLRPRRWRIANATTG